MGTLSGTQVGRTLRGLRGWKGNTAAIRRTFTKRDFVRAMAFVNAVALLAERANHHPDIDIRWNRVALTLSTHSAGGVTEKDIALARSINAL